MSSDAKLAAAAAAAAAAAGATSRQLSNPISVLLRTSIT